MSGRNQILVIPQNSGGGGGGSVNSVSQGNGISVDNTDPANPVVSAAVLGTVVPVNTPAVAGMNPQQTAEALQGQINELESFAIAMAVAL